MYFLMRKRCHKNAFYTITLVEVVLGIRNKVFVTYNEIKYHHVGFPDIQNVFFLSMNMRPSQYGYQMTIVSILSIVYGDLVRNEDICGPQNGRRVYLELGEKGILRGENTTFVKNISRQSNFQSFSTTNSSHEQCSLELVTCPSCVIIISFQSFSLPHHCDDGSFTMDNPCRCDYVWISEPPYEDVSGTPFCGMYAPITYRSSTRTLSISLFYSQFHKSAFTLEYTAERNRLHLRGTESTPGVGLNGTTMSGGILTSPFFPARYPRDLGLEYIITCPNQALTCRIRLLFSDFQLATVSIMEFYDWNGQRLDVSSGARFRPPVILSNGPSLLIRFYANGGTGLGYKAFYSFVIGHHLDKSIQPITDCGGYVENFGGTITMMDMVGQQGIKTYDCVWLIRPQKNFLHMKTHIYLKVIAFADMAGTTELTIKQGPTSALPSLEVLRHPGNHLQVLRNKEHVAPITNGFHVSLRGTFGTNSHLAVAYSTFSYMDCFPGTDFLCQNHRCIPSQLNCDGFDHCGDNSDEPTTCYLDWDTRERKWHNNKANYYFPKIDHYPDLKTATLVFVASSLGLIILISALIILLYRMGTRARQQRELQSRLQTISELLDGARIDEISITQDDPPVYEAPPGYDEVVKVGIESEVLVGCKQKTTQRYSPVTRSYNFTELVYESEEASTSQTTFVPHSSSNVPESPPPPYITPPGTVPRSTEISSLPSSSETNELERCRFGSRKYQLRRTWLSEPNDHFFSRSLPNECQMGEYRDRDDQTDVELIEQNNSQDVLRDTRQESDPEPETIGDDETIQEAVALFHEEDVDPISNSRKDYCSCEGACGCANDTSLILNLSNQEEDNNNETPSLKNAIVRLLGTRSNKSPQLVVSLNSTTTSTTPSTPSCSLKRSIGRISIRSSCDNYITKITTISSSNSYEKLQNDLTNDWELPSSDRESRGKRRKMFVEEEMIAKNNNCDFESLYESIRVLDSFMAEKKVQRRPTSSRYRSQTLAVMSFGTPQHRAEEFNQRCLTDRIGRYCKRISRSADDNLSN